MLKVDMECPALHGLGASPSLGEGPLAILGVFMG